MNLKKYTIAILFFASISCLQNDENKLRQQIALDTDVIFENLLELRSDLHRYPELSGKEKRTSKIVADYLRNLDFEVITNITENSVIGILKGEGKETGKNIAWRSDMDAIRIETNDTLFYKSLNDGIAHMCGHDVHATIGLGIANILSKHKKKINGTVYFIFQPSEETFIGAKELVENGLFEIISPDEIYALHMGPSERGTVSVKSEELFAFQKKIQINFKVHENDKALQSFVKKITDELVRNNSNEKESSLEFLTDSIFGLGNQETVYKDYFIKQNIETINNNDTLSFNINFLETNKDKISNIPFLLRDKIYNSEFKDSFLSIKFLETNPTVYNDPELTRKSLDILDDKYVEEIYGKIPYFNEDFIYYQQKIPGVIFLFGGSNSEKGILAMPHSPDFAVDDSAIKIGVEIFSSFIIERTNSK